MSSWIVAAAFPFVLPPPLMVMFVFISVLYVFFVAFSHLLAVISALGFVHIILPPVGSWGSEGITSGICLCNSKRQVFFSVFHH